ncbi:segregation/condensation protein A, partial [Tritonibacter sp. SIMBA_163]|uniref:segregation/condensation protein A n=1 Tax=Tritonibacter sp. SIMBA_163 TaxID=3080868 RepID=UPI00397FEDCE
LYSKAPADLSELQAPSDFLADEANPYDMLGAFQKMLRRKQLRAPLSTRVARQEVSIKEQMGSMVERLKSFKGRANFSELFPSDDQAVLV